MNFVWLDINASWSHSSLALPALHANLAKQTQDECNMQVVSGTIKSGIPQILEELQAKEPSYVFATAWLFNIDYLNQILSRISSLCPVKGIFLGGPEFLGDNREFLESHKYVTAVFKGEGEDTFEPFIRSLLNQDNGWKKLPGFEWMENGSYMSCRSVTVRDFTALQPPEVSSMFRWDKSFVQLETSRGCFNSCRFCVSGIEKAPVQNIPVGELRSRLQNIAAHGIRQVRVLDRTFNGNPRRALELLELFKEFAGKLNFHLEVHPALLFPPGENATACETEKATSGAENAPEICATEGNVTPGAENTPGICATEENVTPGAENTPNFCATEENITPGAENTPGICATEGNVTCGAENAPNFCATEQQSSVGKLRRTLAEVPEGLLHIEAGIQTLRQEVLDRCARKGSCAQAVRGLEFLIGTGKFEVHADLIAGLPGYTYNDLVEDTLQMMQIGPAEIQLESLKLLPGTHFRRNADALEIRYSPAPPYEVLSTPHISYKELNRAMALSRIIDLWYNDPKWRETFRTIFCCGKAAEAPALAAKATPAPESCQAAPESCQAESHSTPGIAPQAGSRGELLHKLIGELAGTETLTQPLSLESKGLLLYRFCKKNIPEKSPLISLAWARNGLSIKNYGSRSKKGEFLRFELSHNALNRKPRK